MNYEPPSFVKRRTPRVIAALRRLGALYAALIVGAGAFTTGYVYGERSGRLEAAHPSPKERLVKVLNIGSAAPKLEQVKFDLFWEVWNEAKSKFYRQPVTDQKLFYGSLQGLVSSLGDPYSVFFEPSTAEQFGADLQGKLEGIGAEIGIKHDIITVISPLTDSPAERAGLRSGDKILSIDSETTAGMSVEVAVSKIRGAKGTVVALKVLRSDVADPFEIKITRDEIKVRSVRTRMERTVGGKKVARFEVRQFAQDTASLFDQEARRALGERPIGIIVDVRNNPGGYLDAAVDLAGLWIKDGVALEERDSQGLITDVRADGSGILRDVPTVVLVNEGSASASEILAGALQDHGAATIVGQVTFGKGSVQDLREFEDGSALKITIGQWLTPKGRTIQDQGIVPDIPVDYTEQDFNADRDPQLEKALEILEQDASRSGAP